MQMEKALSLRKKWGNKSCNHPNLVKEYNLGSATGDYVCTTCGEAGWGKDWNKEQRSQNISC